MLAALGELLPGLQSRDQLLLEGHAFHRYYFDLANQSPSDESRQRHHGSACLRWLSDDAVRLTQTIHNGEIPARTGVHRLRQQTGKEGRRQRGTTENRTRCCETIQCTFTAWETKRMSP